jgi:hypothetical protein
LSNPPSRPDQQCYGLVSLITAAAAFFKWGHPKWRQAKAGVRAVRDTLVGREAQHDWITDEVISHALPVSAAGVSLWPRYIADPDCAHPIRGALRSAALAVGGSCAALAASPLLFKFVADDPGAGPIVQQVPWVCTVALYGFFCPGRHVQCGRAGLAPAGEVAVEQRGGQSRVLDCAGAGSVVSGGDH